MLRIFKVAFVNLMLALTFFRIYVYVLPNFSSCYESHEDEREDMSYMNFAERSYNAQDNQLKESIDLKHGEKYFCKHWAVVTSTSHPTDAIRHIASDIKWCLVIVEDINKPFNNSYIRSLRYLGIQIAFLDIAKQEMLFPVLSAAIPLGKVGRKNIGYIFAIQNGAAMIWDFESNNHGLLNINNMYSQDSTSVLQRCNGDHKLFNYYPYFGVSETYIWPRGFPLEYVRDMSTSSPLCRLNISIKSVGVIQAVSKNDPDVDATFRFTGKYPITFQAVQTDPMILVPRYSYCPFNMRATLWTKQSFIYMLLPVSVSGRVSDIWRSYIAQYFFHRDGINLLFSPPSVVQLSGYQNIMEDFFAETDIYKKSNVLIDFLVSFQFHYNASLENLYIKLYERHFINLEDVHLIRIWTKLYKKYSESTAKLS